MRKQVRIHGGPWLATCKRVDDACKKRIQPRDLAHWDMGRTPIADGNHSAGIWRSAVPRFVDEKDAVTRKVGGGGQSSLRVEHVRRLGYRVMR